MSFAKTWYHNVIFNRMYRILNHVMTNELSIVLILDAPLFEFNKMVSQFSYTEGRHFFPVVDATLLLCNIPEWFISYLEPLINTFLMEHMSTL